MESLDDAYELGDIDAFVSEFEEGCGNVPLNIKRLLCLAGEINEGCSQMLLKITRREAVLQSGKLFMSLIDRFALAVDHLIENRGGEMDEPSVRKLRKYSSHCLERADQCMSHYHDWLQADRQLDCIQSEIARRWADKGWNDEG